MADFSKNITNAVNVFGGGPSTKWGQAVGSPYTFTWGSSKWGEGESLPIAFVKVVSNAQTIDYDIAGKSFTKRQEIGSFSADFTAASQTLRQGSWYYVFVSDTYLASERDFASWTSGTATDATFTCLSVAATTWSSGA